MEKILVSILALLAVSEAAAQAPYTMWRTQRNDAGTGNFVYTQSHICSSDGTDGMPVWDGDTLREICVDLSADILVDKTTSPWSVRIPALDMLDGDIDAIVSLMAGMETDIAGKFDQPTGTTSQYIRGDGSLATFPTLFDGAYSSLSGIPSTFTPASHNQAWSTITSTPTTLSGYGIVDAASASHAHACADLSNDTTIGCGIVTAANAAAVRALVASTQSHIADGATDAATDAPTTLSGLLITALIGELNATNAKQNALAAKYNDLAAKFNTLLDAQEANAIVAP